MAGKKKIAKTVEQQVDQLKKKATRLKKRMAKVEGQAIREIKKQVKRAQRKARRIGKALKAVKEAAAS